MSVFTLLIISSGDGAERGGEATVPEGPCSFEARLVVGAWGSVVTVTGGGLDGCGNFDDSSVGCIKIVAVHSKFRRLLLRWLLCAVCDERRIKIKRKPVFIFFLLSTFSEIT